MTRRAFLLVPLILLACSRKVDAPERVAWTPLFGMVYAIDKPVEFWNGNQLYEAPAGCIIARRDFWDEHIRLLKRERKLAKENDILTRQIQALQRKS